MYPNVAYILHDFMDYPLNGSLSHIPTLGCCLAFALIYTSYAIFYQLNKVFTITIQQIFLAIIFTILSCYIGSFVFLLVEKLVILQNFTFTFALNSVGSLLGCLVGGYFYAKIYKWHVVYLLNVAAKPMLLGYAIARLGCHLAGDGDWGIANIQPIPNYWIFPSWLWAFDYPNNILNKGIFIEGCQGIYCKKLPFPVFPIAIYEVLACLFLFIIASISKYWQQKYNFIHFLYCIGIIKCGTDSLRDLNTIKCGYFNFSLTQIFVILVVTYNFLDYCWLKRNKIY